MNIRKIFSVILASPLFLIFFINAQAAAQYRVEIDELTDVKQHYVIVPSEEIGSWGKKAFLYYKCADKLQYMFVVFPEFIGTPVGIDIRFDKEPVRKLRKREEIGKWNDHAIKIKGSCDDCRYFGGNLEYAIEKIASGNKLVVRGYDFSGRSKQVYTFKLVGTSSLITKAKKGGSCKSREEWERDK